MNNTAVDIEGALLLLDAVFKELEYMIRIIETGSISRDALKIHTNFSIETLKGIKILLELEAEEGDIK